MPCRKSTERELVATDGEVTQAADIVLLGIKHIKRAELCAVTGFKEILGRNFCISIMSSITIKQI